MARKEKEQLRREHLTDEQWEAFSKMCDFIAKVNRRKLATAPQGGN